MSERFAHSMETQAGNTVYPVLRGARNMKDGVKLAIAIRCPTQDLGDFMDEVAERGGSEQIDFARGLREVYLPGPRKLTPLSIEPDPVVFALRSVEEITEELERLEKIAEDEASYARELRSALEEENVRGEKAENIMHGITIERMNAEKNVERLRLNHGLETRYPVARKLVEDEINGHTF